MYAMTEGRPPRLAELVDPLSKVPCKARQNHCRTRPVPQSGLVVTKSRQSSKLRFESRYDSYCKKQDGGHRQCHSLSGLVVSDCQ